MEKHRRALCHMLWRDMSPDWAFDEATFARSAGAFENPDFVAVVIHCYRFNAGREEGDPALRPLEALLARKPPITVPTVTLDGTADPLKPGGTAGHAPLFVGRHTHRAVDGGHNLPQQHPQAFAEAVLALRGWTA